MFDTIAAISTGIINQPVSIIRISGPEAFVIAKSIFTGKEGYDKMITFGFIKDKKNLIDEVLVSWFKGPNTFTGEDIVEINAHGGVVNTNRILELILAKGARLAERGEFSRRAFLNGKMDLIKAEAIHDLIFAKTSKQANLAIKKFDGETSKFLDVIKKILLGLIATIETNIDYPEYDDIEILTNENLLPKLKTLSSDLTNAISLSEKARYIFKGISIAIVGKPNAGKSSLLNALIEEDKAIVTDQPGTTRDIVEGQMVIDGMLISLVDTAGIHQTKDKIEKIGIEKSLSQIGKADLVIHLIDSSQGETSEDKKIYESVQSRNYLKIFSKSDLKKVNQPSISSQNGNITELIEAIKFKIPQININDHRLITNARQLSLIKQAQSSIESAILNLENGLEPDEIIVDVREAWTQISNITGQADNEKLLDEMFLNFCLGK